MATTAEKPKTKVITGKVRFCYAHVFEPTAINDSDTKKYSVSVLIDKSDKKTIAAIEAAVENAKEAGKASKFGGKIPSNLKLPLRDGDLERDEDPNYAGKYFISATSTTKPQIVDANLNEIISKEEFYSGCYGRASINFYPFNANGSKGVAAGLQNLQFLEHGEALAGSSSAADDFADSLDDLM